MFRTKSKKQNLPIVLNAIYLVSACIVLINELLAINNRVPGGNFPIEHKFSWARVLLFCSVGVISALVIWIFTAEKHLNVFLPPLKVVMLLAGFATLVSVVSNYASVSGWCCEVYPTRYFGFPISYLNGNSLSDALTIIPKEGTIIHYVFPYIFLFRFLLDLLFWSNSVIVTLSLLSLSTEKTKSVTRRGKEQQLPKTD